MTEAEWLGCDDPRKMLAFLHRIRRRSAASDRQLRLFAAACVRHAARGAGGAGIGYTALAEWYEDGVGPPVPLDQGLGQRAGAALHRESPWSAAMQAVHLCGEAVLQGSQDADALVSERAAQAELLRCIFGNPFRPATVNSAWLTWNDATIPRLAQAAYEQRSMPTGHLDSARLAVLADALEEAGVTDAWLLEHLRGPGPHVRGCWVVDLLLGKE
jgi:hypothetical protein